ncbi:MAG TPA: transglutaminase domain-containing protein [Pseudobacteroides sp.]|nr:transglutaminase domain-containing protein [Pseudobacteroides sp.]
MSIKKVLPNYLINFILTVFMSFSFIYALTTTLNLKYKPYIIILAISAVTLFYSVITINKKVLKISIVSILVLFFGTIGFLLYKFGFNEIYVNIDYFCNWLYDYVVSFKVRLIPVYGIVIAAFFILSVTLFVFIFTLKRFNFIPILIFGSLLFAIQFVNKFLVAPNTFYLFLFLMVIYYMKHIFVKNSSSGTNEYINPSAFILFIVPLSALILFVTYIIPSRPKPLEWKWLDEKLKIFYNSYIGTAVPSKFEFFSLSETGFGNSGGTLGGRITKNKTLVLKVKSPRTIYLKGAVKDYYTGNSWVNTDHSTWKINSKANNFDLDYNNIIRTLSERSYAFGIEYEENRLLRNYIELLSGMSLATGDEDFIKNYFTRDNIEITFHNLSTKTVFLTENAYQINASNRDLIVSSNGEVTTSKQMSKNSKYSFSSLNMVINKKMEDLLRKSTKDFYQKYIDDYNYIMEFLIDKAKQMCDSYDENADIPVEIIDERGYKYVIFAMRNKLITGKYEFNMDSITADNIFEIFPRIDSNNIPQRVQDIVEQSIGRENFTPFRDKILMGIDIENIVAYYVIPLNEASLKRINNNFNNKINDFRLSINPMHPTIQNILEANAREAYTKYLQLPESLPKRVKDLAKEVTSGKDNRYDKVKAIESYLSKNYKYTLTPPNTPSGRDFVDYFLFDIKKGYCTYYATSMVVMLRSIGIPARYVEGYIVSSGSKKGNEYHITNEKAHAWVEAYFEGFGWIRFEPTSAYASVTASESNTDSRSGGSTGGSRPSWIDNVNNPGNNYDLEVNELPADNKKNIAILIVLIVVGLSILSFAGLMLYNSAKSRRKFNKLAKMDPRESIISAYKLILHYTSILGYKKQDAETPKDYANRMGNSLFANHANLKAVTDVFIIARYSKNDITEKEKSFVLDSLTKLSLFTKENMGKFKHFTLKYLQGKI